MRLIGLDPGLQRTGWGVIEAVGSRLSPVANGTVTSNAADDLATRLRQIFEGVQAVIERYRPEAAAVEETFVNKNPASTLKLGQVRGVVLLAPALAGLAVAEYTPNHIKKSVVGAGHADKGQIHHMVKVLLPTVEITGPDAADALAVAICHAHHAASAKAFSRGLIAAGARP
ncbi:crossover junction endodeoxyribonuclease RuvC [Zavarzinia sp.]|uniref:crossover junction endodeoxyribonuclease RuvC n=1 Tax=Zavarzinia sp. TaxID=2027920 RepID=UPI0035681DB5